MTVEGTWRADGSLAHNGTHHKAARRYADACVRRRMCRTAGQSDDSQRDDPLQSHSTSGRVEGAHSASGASLDACNPVTCAVNGDDFGGASESHRSELDDLVSDNCLVQVLGHAVSQPQTKVTVNHKLGSSWHE